MADLDGKTILLTGATNGIGLEASVELARRGATLVMVGRDPARTQKAVAGVKARSGSDRVTSMLCDFSSQRQIRQLADEFLAKHDRLDVLVNNAGAVFSRRTLTEDGIESTFGVNHLGYFLLTNLLLDLLKKSAPARIVNVASRSHYRGDLDLDDVGYEKGGYFIMKAYSRSKLANVLFTKELARRLEGSGVTVNCLHPGVVATGIWANAPFGTRTIIGLVAKLFFITPAEGARTIVQLAAEPVGAQTNGGYFSELEERKPSRLARDETLARRLWEASEKLTGLAPDASRGAAG